MNRRPVAAAPHPYGNQTPIPGARTLDTVLAVRIARMAEIMTRLAEAVYTDHGLRLTDLRILSLVQELELISIAEISRRARIDKAWVSRLIKQLEAKGLVERHDHPVDTRAFLFSLTRSGQALQRVILPIAVTREASMLDGIDGAALFAMLDRLDKNIARILGERHVESSSARYSGSAL